MEFLKKLDWLMKRDGLNKHTLAQKSGVPYTTIVGLYDRGPENARLSTLNKLCECFNVPLDYLVVDKYEKPEDFQPNGNCVSLVCDNAEERELIMLFRMLNVDGKNLFMNTVRTFAGNPAMIKEQSGAKAI